MLVNYINYISVLYYKLYYKYINIITILYTYIYIYVYINYSITICINAAMFAGPPGRTEVRGPERPRQPAGPISFTKLYYTNICYAILYYTILYYTILLLYCNTLQDIFLELDTGTQGGITLAQLKGPPGPGP